jgi:predicted ATPase
MRRGRGRPLVQGGAERRLLGFAGDEFGYAIDLGLPPPAMSMFGSDPEIKAESVWAGPVLRPAAVLAERGASGAVRIRAAGGGWDRPPGFLEPLDSMLGQAADPQRAPELRSCASGSGPGGSTTSCGPTRRPGADSPDRHPHPRAEPRRRRPARRAADDPRDR